MFFNLRRNKKNTYFRLFDNEALKKVHKRIFFGTSIFILIYFSVYVKLTQVMVFSNLFKDDNLIVINEEKKVRGNIYDRNGELLATSLRSFSLSANPKKLNNKEVVASKLSDILGIKKIDIINKINKEISFVWIKRDITPNQHFHINNLGEIGLQIHKEQKRLYPQGNIISHVVGFTDIDENPLSGIERGMNYKLENNEDVYLSIDIRLQNLITEELRKTINKFNAVGGMSVILDINNGQLLATSSLPDFDPNNINFFPRESFFNSATHGVFEMGSTFKPITMAIGLDSKKIKLTDTFEVNSPIKIGKFTIDDYYPLEGPLSIREIIVNSSNIGTAKVAEVIGSNVLKKYLEKFGLLEKLSLEIPETGTPLIPNPWLPINTMTIGYGYGLSITPIQLCSVYASLVNNGQLIQPTFIKKEGKILSSDVITEQTSNKLRDLLRAVVLETKWTGPRAKVAGYQVGGKTGTAELLEKKGYLKKANLSSFIGVFPMNEPKYVVLVMIKNPKGIEETYFNTTGAWVSAPVVSNIIKKMVNIIGLPPDSNSERYNANLKKIKFNGQSRATL